MAVGLLSGVVLVSGFSSSVYADTETKNSKETKEKMDVEQKKDREQKLKRTTNKYKSIKITEKQKKEYKKAIVKLKRLKTNKRFTDTVKEYVFLNQFETALKTERLTLQSDIDINETGVSEGYKTTGEYVEKINVFHNILDSLGLTEKSLKEFEDKNDRDVQKLDVERTLLDVRRLQREKYTRIKTSLNETGVSVNDISQQNGLTLKIIEYKNMLKGRKLVKAPVISGQKRTKHNDDSQNKISEITGKSGQSSELLNILNSQRGNKEVNINLNEVKSFDLTSINKQGYAYDKAEQVVKQGYKHLGVPYVWGGTTTNGFDCSGLMQYIYRDIGVTIPRVARDQQKVGIAIPFESLQPGDLIFIHNPATHVAMYIGDGYYLHAPQPNDVVRIEKLDLRYWTNARRVLTSDKNTVAQGVKDLELSKLVSAREEAIKESNYKAKLNEERRKAEHYKREKEKALELKRLEQKEKIEKKKKERLEALKKEKEKLKKEKLKKEKEKALEEKKKELEKKEKERKEKEKKEKERLEAERLESERLEAEKLEAERLEQEKEDNELEVNKNA